MSLRQEASELIIQVLAEKMNIQQAIKAFPRDENDDSLMCAFHALLHYEADDEIRKDDPEYAEEQLDHMENIAMLLKNNEPLPINVIEDYKNYYEEAPFASKKGFKQLIKRLFRITI